jgi:hypothetical protein
MYQDRSQFFAPKGTLVRLCEMQSFFVLWPGQSANWDTIVRQLREPRQTQDKVSVIMD